MPPSGYPPGLLYIFQLTPKLVLPLLPVFFAQRWVFYELPSYVWALAYILALPVMLVLTGVARYLQEEREIKRLGARRVPEAPSHWPGGIDSMIKMVHSFSHGYIADIWEELSQNIGQIFNIRLLWEDLIITTEPNHIKAMLATDFDNFEKGPKFHWYMQSVLGTGVFNSDGDRWKFHRGITRPFFARDRVTDFETFDRHAEVVVAKLKERFAQGEAIDFQNQIALRNRLTVSWPLAEFWKDKTKDSMKIINGFIDPILQNVISKKGTVEKKAPVATDVGEGKTLLDHLAEQTDDRTILKDETLNILLAGRDTTMATLTFTIYCLSENPDVLTKLRQEILTHIGSNRRPTFDDVRECKYMRAVINETLRLYPPVPFNVRRSKQSATWSAPDGGKPYYIPAGVEIPYSVWLMHRRADLWGPDAQEFDPERFLDDRLHKYLTPNLFIFLPFNAGPRICLGQQFALNETSFMLVRLLQAFDSITLAPDAQPLDSHPPASWKSVPGRQGKEKLWAKSHLTLYSHKGLWLKMGQAQYTDTV